MSKEQPDASEKRKGAGRSAAAELVIPVAGILFALYYFSTVWNAPWTAQVSSFFVGAVLILCSVAVTIRIALAARRGEMRIDFDSLIEPHSYILKRVLLFVLTVSYIIMVDWAGFTLTTFSFLALAMLLLNEGRRPLLVCALSAALAVSGWLLFVVAFEVRFPRGPFEELMRGIL